MSGELQQVDPVVLKRYGSFLHQTRRSRVFSHLGRMMRTSDGTKGATSYSFVESESVFSFLWVEIVLFVLALYFSFF